MAYKAIICKITNLKKHSNADRLMIATVANSQVVVGNEHHEGEIGIFFPCDGRLENFFCEALDLYPRVDEHGKRIGGGFFDRGNPRVRAQKFRGEKSDGFWLPLTSLEGKFDTSSLVNGTLLDSLKVASTGVEVRICTKQFSRATEKMRGEANKVKTKKSADNPLFEKHVETEQFRFFLDQIPIGSVCYLNIKFHGTSGRYALLKKPIQITIPKWWEKFCFWRKPKPQEEEWEFLVGSRNIVCKNPEGGFYGNDEFRFRIGEQVRKGIRKGETVFGELVGWVSEDKPIMAPHYASKTKDKEVQKRYGDKIIYSYGVPNGQCEFYVYRITQLDHEGNHVELPHSQMVTRASQMGFKAVSSMTPYPVVVENLEALKTLVEGLTEGPDLICPEHPREGVVIRVETPNGKTIFFKNKSHLFKVLEGIAKENDEEVDLEEVS